MKSDNLDSGVGSDFLPRPKCFAENKKWEKNGFYNKVLKAKTIQNYYLGIVKKFQSIRLRHF